MPHSQADLHKKLLGKKGEKLVLEYLKKQGCKLIKKNYKTPFGEADLIVQDGDIVAFVEVKTRSGDSYGTPAEAVTSQKRARYRNIAKYFWLQTGQEPNARFDVAEVWSDGSIEYIQDAFC